MSVQRLRIRFSRGEEIRFISHLDLMRLWQRALVRAGGSLGFPAPSLQSQVPSAEYAVRVATGKGEKDVEAALQSLLAKGSLPWEHQRDTGPRRYDLRALIEDLWLIAWEPGGGTIGMRLSCDSRGSGGAG